MMSFSGSDPYGGPGVLARHARERGVDPGCIPRLLLLSAGMATSRLASHFERMVAGRAIRSHAMIRQPVFILGHYRSGTTLVHKLLAADPRFGSVQTFDLFLPHCPTLVRDVVRRALQWALTRFQVKQPFFHDYDLRLDDPNELEPLLLSMGSRTSVYWGYLFPRHARELLSRWIAWPTSSDGEEWERTYDYHVRRLSRRMWPRRLVIKDPPNTGRVRALVALYPNAEFVHIRRDPRDVVASMVRLWRDTIEPRFALQHIDSATIENVVLEHYELLLRRWCEDRKLIPSGHLVELRYETFVEDPMRGIEAVYEGLRLADIEDERPAILKRLEDDRGYRPAAAAASSLGPFAEERIRDWRRAMGYDDSVPLSPQALDGHA